VIGVLSVILFAVLLARFEAGAEREILRATAGGTALWRAALFVMVGVYSPIVQEIVFRGLLLQGLLQRMRAWVAIGVSSAVFALVHGADGSGAVINAFLVGIVLGVLYLRFRSLAAPVTAHVATNSSVMLYLFWALNRVGR
jgi:membrane protease YdiL (CAAX protease family)